MKPSFTLEKEKKKKYTSTIEAKRRLIKVLFLSVYCYLHPNPTQNTNKKIKKISHPRDTKHIKRFFTVGNDEKLDDSGTQQEKKGFLR